MTCLEAQSNIMAFVEKKLPDDKVTDFVRHMRYCKNCSEELEIYYTLVVGMRQLDNNEELSKDFKEELNKELNRLDHKVKSVKRFKISTFSVVFVVAVVIMFFWYTRILGKVYNIEQSILKQEQGETYFYDYFGDEISFCKDDIVAKKSVKNQTKEITFYEMVHEYNIKHPDTEETENVK